MRNAFLGKRPSDVGHVLENAVFMELLRRGFKVTAGKIDKKEIDFVAVGHTDRVYVQVCRTLADEKVEQREFSPLLAVADAYPKFVLSMDRIGCSRDGLLKGAFRLAEPCCISREASRGIRFLSEISADVMLGASRSRQLRREMLTRFASRWSVR